MKKKYVFIWRLVMWSIMGWWFDDDEDYYDEGELKRERNKQEENVSIKNYLH